MIKRVITQLALATTVSLISMSASAAIVNGVFTITSANILNLYSTTLDGACNPSAVGDFFSCSPDSPTGLAVSVTNVGAFQGGGSLDIQYDNATGEITQVNDMLIMLRDLDITIAGATPTLLTVRRGTPGPGTPPDDIAHVDAGASSANGTVDPDEDFMFNTGSSVTLFQHNDAPNEDAPDFSTFSDIVDTCVGPLCALVALLGLDGIKYELDGTVSAGGGNSIILTAETGNSSSYELAFTTAVVPIPAAVWLFGSALGLLGWIRRRQAT